MALDLQNDCVFSGPALPLPFVTLNLEAELNRLRVLPKATGEDARQLAAFWPTYRAHLRQLVSQGGSVRVRNQVFDPLTACGLSGYAGVEAAEDVQTREGLESGGFFLVGANGARLRLWTAALNEDLDAPARRGEAYRFSHTRIASRVLLASGERLGLLSNGTELRLLICDPARLDSQVSISLDASWKRSREVPDSFRLFLALAKPEGVCAIPELVEKARLQQAKVTKDLRLQARLAVEEFIQALIDAPENHEALAGFTDRTVLARRLWREGLITVYRLLFVLKLESTDDPAKCFSFASGSLWRNSFSPGVALAPLARAVLDRGEQTGSMLESGLRNLFRLLESGLQCTELNVKPMGGLLFAAPATPVLSSLQWPEHGVARLLDHLLWTTPRRGVATRERVHYGPLDVEDLGRVYEALLELDPGIATEPMCRLRRAKLEVVVPAAQGERYRSSKPTAEMADTEAEEVDEPDEEEVGGRTRVEWIEEISSGRFYLRVGLGRKSTGSFFTPHPFVRFLVQETLGPLVERVSPRDDPNPVAILRLKVVDKAMGSGHFLVEAARFLGDALYEACRRCDDLARAATQAAERFAAEGDQGSAYAEQARAADFIQRVEVLPDPDDELLRYLPSRSVEGAESGLSQRKAIALCRRMVAVHCLYGVDKNPLAVELAKLALWIECHAEGLPLTFLDHRLVVGDSLTGPFFEHLLKYPGSQQPLDDLFTNGLNEKLSQALASALQDVRDLEATVGISVAEIETKRNAKTHLDRGLAPFRLLAAAWSGGVLLGGEACDDTGYAKLARSIADTGDLPTTLCGDETAALRNMIAKGLGRAEFRASASRDEVLAQLNSPDCIPAFSFDLGFPEVFYPTGDVNQRLGFDADLGNPPWDKLRAERREMLGSLDIDFLLGKEFEGSGLTELDVESRLRDFPEAKAMEDYCVGLTHLYTRSFATASLCRGVISAGGDLDLYRLFCIRSATVCAPDGQLGMVLGGGAAKNPSDAGLRKLLFGRYPVTVFVHYLNLRQLFDGVTSRMGFTLVASSAKSTSVRLTRDLTLFEQLLDLQETRERESVLSEIEQTGSPFANVIGNVGTTLPEWLSSQGICLGTDLHRTKDAQGLTSVSELIKDADDGRPPAIRDALVNRGFFVSYQGRSMHQYNHLPMEKAGKWDPKAPLAISMRDAGLEIAQRARFFRLCLRATPGHPETNARTVVACLLPPGAVATNSLLVETAPAQRPNSAALLALAVLNSKVTDYQLRPHVQANMNLKIMQHCVMRALPEKGSRFLVHCALAELATSEFISLHTENSLPAVLCLKVTPRALIDAVVAITQGLNFELFERVLAHFSRYEGTRPEYGVAIELFDEISRDGLEAFTRRHDPYWDIPLNESLPRPVIDLPIPAETAVPKRAPASREDDLFGNHS